MKSDWEKYIRPAGNGITVDLNLKGVEIEYETAASIIRIMMIDQYDTLKEEIKAGKSIENPQKYQTEDLKYNEKFLDAVVVLIKHYAAYSCWPEELKGEDDG